MRAVETIVCVCVWSLVVVVFVHYRGRVIDESRRQARNNPLPRRER